MREKEGDRYYHAASNACERIVTALCNNTLYLNEYMVRVRIYPVILYNLLTYYYVLWEPLWILSTISRSLGSFH